jgi:hypothetical protein
LLLLEPLNPLLHGLKERTKVAAEELALDWEKKAPLLPFQTYSLASH